MPMRSADLEKVRALPPFAGVSEEVFGKVTASAFLQRFPAGTTLLTEGDHVDFLYVLLEGCVELDASWRDKDTVLTILRPVSSFVLAAVVLDSEALMSAQTVEPSRVLMISGEALRRELRHDAGLACLAAEELSRCYQSVVRSLKNQKLRGGAERLANYLIAQQTRQGGAETLVLPHEKRLLASLLGMTPENLSRAFTMLADYGVEVNGREITITRPVVLNRLAKPDPLMDGPPPRADALEPPASDPPQAAAARR